MRAALAVALTLVLAGCGGGSTAGPVAAPGDATTAAQPSGRAPSSASPPPTTTTSAAPRTTTGAPTAGATKRPGDRRPRPAGGAAPPAEGGSSAAAADLPDAPADAAPASQPGAQPQTSALDERADLTLVRRVSPSHYFQQGTVTGTYDGTIELEARITSKGVLVRFTATLPGGTISGRGIAVAILDSATWPSLRGTARVTGGTGRFAGLHGRRLKVTGRAKPDASRAHVRLAGTVSRS